MAAEYGSLPQAARLRADLVRALDGSLDIPARLAERERRLRRAAAGVARPAAPGHRRPGSSRTATVIEVRAQDAHGLLHRIGRALEQAGVAVRSAHISTLGANAVDTFYVTDTDGRPAARRRGHGRRRAPCRAALRGGAPLRPVARRPRDGRAASGRACRGRIP